MKFRSPVPFLISFVIACSSASASPAEDKLALGDKLMAAGDASTALHFYDKAIDLNNASWKAYLHRGDALMKLGERSYAMDDYKKVLQLYPGCPEALARMHRGGRHFSGKRKAKVKSAKTSQSN